MKLLSRFILVFLCLYKFSESVPCEDFLEFEGRGDLCDTNYAKKNYISCQFEVCPGEHAYIEGIRGGDSSSYDLFVRLYSASGESLQVASSNDGITELEFELPDLAPCESFEARLGCFGQSTTCSGYLNVSVEGKCVCYFFVPFIHTRPL